jgi:hypothetical protein
LWFGRAAGALVVAGVVVLTAAALAALAAGSAATTSPSADRQATAQRTIDETLLCSTSFLGRSRNVTVRAHRGTGRSGTRWLRPAFAALTTGPAPDIAGRIPDAREQALDNTLGWVTAGRPTPDSTVTPDLVAWPGVDYPLATWGTLARSSQFCPARLSGRVPLTAPGLVARRVGPFDVRFKCNGASARVFVRMRATLASRVTAKPYRQFLGIRAPLSRAEIAVRTESGKPLVYAEVLASGKSRLLTAKRK